MRDTSLKISGVVSLLCGTILMIQSAGRLGADPGDPPPCPDVAVAQGVMDCDTATPCENDAMDEKACLGGDHYDVAKFPIQCLTVKTKLCNSISRKCGTWIQCDWDIEFVPACFKNAKQPADPSSYQAKKLETGDCQP